MYEKIKKLADEAIALQNKGRMDAALREIGELAGCAVASDAYVEFMKKGLSDSAAVAVHDMVTTAAVVTGSASPLSQKQKAAKK